MGNMVASSHAGVWQASLSLLLHKYRDVLPADVMLAPGDLVEGWYVALEERPDGMHFRVVDAVEADRIVREHSDPPA